MPRREPLRPKRAWMPLEETSAILKLWTREGVLAVIEAAAEDGGEDVAMLKLWWKQAMARPLLLVTAFMGDVIVEPPPRGGWFAPHLGPADYMDFLPPITWTTSGHVGFLNEALYQLMLYQAQMYYCLPPYNEIEIAHRCVADFFFVFIDR